MTAVALPLAGLVVMSAAAAVVLLVAARHLIRKLNDQQAKIDFVLNTVVNTQAELTSLMLPAVGAPGMVRTDVVCSLTTLKDRLPIVHFAIASILLQSIRPRSVELYLGDTMSAADLPDSLTRLAPLGLNIHFVRDVGPHTKLVYALADFPEATIITVDDDIAYPSNAVAALLRTAAQCPGAVVGNWARRLDFEPDGKVRGIRDGALLTPPDLHRNLEQHRQAPKPDLQTFVYGTGAVLYPPGALHPQVHDAAAFQTLCPTEDDIWFKAMALLNGTPAVHTHLGIDPRHHTLRGSQSTALRHTNHEQRRNEAQMRAVFEAYDLYRLFPSRRG